MKKSALVFIAALLVVGIGCKERKVTNKPLNEDDVLYTDVKLYLPNPVEDLVKGQSLRMNDWTGKPFTGTTSSFYRKNDQLYSESVYENGLNTSVKMYNNDGSQRTRVEHDYSEAEMVWNRHYNEDDLLIMESKSYKISEDGFGFVKRWHDNGQLQFEMKTDENGKYQGLMTLYDEEGNVLEQENYKDGVLIES